MIEFITMGWFSNLFTNEAVARTAASEAQSSKGVQPYSDIRGKFKDGSVSNQIRVVLDLILRLPASSIMKERYRLESGSRNFGITEHWPNRRKLVELLNFLNRSLWSVDIQRADMKTLLRVIDLCNETLPATLRQLEIQIGQKDWSNEYQTLQKMEKAVQVMLAEIALLPTERSTLNTDTPESDGTKHFPSLDTYKGNEALYGLLVALKEDWDKAADLPLSAEDDYIIERVGNSYLPDTLLLLDRFNRRTGSPNNEKALRVVEEQVKLIHQQVMFVLEQNEDDNLELMAAHTEFLKTKNSRLGITASNDITLEKNNPAEGPEEGSQPR